MDILWFGASSVRLQGSQVSVLADPFDLAPGDPVGPVDIVTISDRRLRGRIADLAALGAPHLVDGPGEYEIKGVPLTGIATSRAAVPEGETATTGRGPRNFVYNVTLDGILVTHLGRLTELPTSSQVHDIGSPDVVLLPLGEPEGLTAARAAQLASQLEAKLLVPMLLGGPNDQAVLESFCKELGADPTPIGPRLSVSASSLGAQTRVVVLQPAPVGPVVA